MGNLVRFKPANPPPRLRRRRPRAAPPSQLAFDLEPPRDASGKLMPLRPRRPATPTPPAVVPDAETWFRLACELEEDDPGAARDAYARALALDSRHADARINLGRLLHTEGLLAEAEAHYRAALAVRPDDATAAFNLGVVLEDLERRDEAIAAYEQALASDPGYADAHYNLARLHEDRGDRAAALRHLRVYRRLTQGR